MGSVRDHIWIKRHVKVRIISKYVAVKAYQKLPRNQNVQTYIKRQNSDNTGRLKYVGAKDVGRRPAASK